ncbi:MAG: hypothetical protein Kow0056_09910 [Coriobacteriia bacterium]
MKKRLGLMISGNFPCVRSGKMTHAMNNHGYEHDALCLKSPRQFLESYREIIHNPLMTKKEMGELIRSHPAEILHIHNEPNWPVIVAKEYAEGRPVVLNVHDLACARPNEAIDPFEAEAFDAADAFIFVSEQQREYAIRQGLPVGNKPYAVIANYVSSSMLVDEKLLPHIGGIVYAGGTDPRSGGQKWRDYSPLADKLGGQLHIYAGNPGTDYGIVHETIVQYPVLMHRLAQHDWGFTGTYRGDIMAHQHSVPNKIFDYFAAGIPIIAMNVPLAQEYVRLGMGLYAGVLDDVVRVQKIDPRPYRKAVLEHRERFTMEARISAVTDLYHSLGV